MTDRNTDVKQKGNFSLIDLLMIIMVVGIILTLMIPLQQTKTYESLVRNSLKDMEMIKQANEALKVNPEWEDYAFDFEHLSSFYPYLKNIDMSIFKYTVSDTAVVATTEQLGNVEKAYYWDLRDKRYRVREDSKDVIIDAWLPF